MSNKTTGVLVIVGVVVAAIAAVLILNPFENFELEPIQNKIKNKNLGLVINSPNPATTLQELDEVYKQASNTGIGRSNVYLFWDILEPEKEQYNWEQSDILMSFNKLNGMKTTIYLSVVNGGSLGPFPDWMGNQALTVNLGDHTVRILDAILSRYDIVDTVILGADIDEHFRYNEGGVINYRHYFNHVYDKIKEKHPSVKLGNTFSLHGILNKNLEHLVGELSLGDFVAFTYFPVDSLNEINKTPQEAKDDLEKIFVMVPNQKVAIFEIGWSTSDFVNGNEQDQVEFIKTSYEFYKENEANLEFFTWYRQYDRPDGTCSPELSTVESESVMLVTGSGFESNQFVIERLGELLCNSGLIDVNGNEKPGWTEFTKQLQQVK